MRKASIVRRLYVFLILLIFGSCGNEFENEDRSGLGLKKVPRSRTLIMDCAQSNICGGQIQDYNSFNPFLPGTTSRTGYNFLYEPLFYYNAFRDEIIPWISTGYVFDDNYSVVKIKIRDGVYWSDGLPWTAHDVVFTINMLKANAPSLTYSTDLENWVENAIAVDSLTVEIELTAPNPRFVFSYLTAMFGLGVPIVPKHIWENQDPTTFMNLDIEKKWPVVSGPYDLTLSEPLQRIWDVSNKWWAAEIGFSEMPQVERIIYLPYMEETKRVQNLLTNAIDTSLDLRPPNIKTLLDSNPSITTWSGRELPFGYVDFWPISLGFNASQPPFDNPDIRRAINFAIDRDQLVEIAWQGAGKPTLLPFPEYPGLEPYFKRMEGLLDKYSIGAVDHEESSAIMRKHGWNRSDGGFWNKEGADFKIIIDIYPIFNDLAPVLVAQLEKAGFDADFRMTSDAYSRMSQGRAHAFLSGHGGSVRDPYLTLRLYHSRFVRPTGVAAEHFWRWKNPKFDQIVDHMAQTSSDDPELMELYSQAMEIWLAELPSIPLVQWYHRIPHNEKYWTNWPTEKNPYMNSAYWHRGWLQVLLNLRPRN